MSETRGLRAAKLWVMRSSESYHLGEIANVLSDNFRPLDENGKRIFHLKVMNDRACKVRQALKRK
jgi:hypothetical protein